VEVRVFSWAPHRRDVAATRKEAAMASAPKIHLHQNDLPDGLDLGDTVAIDTETTGLSLVRDRLCLAQLSGNGADCHLVQFRHPAAYDAPNLRALIADSNVTKLFHYGRFDIAMLERHIGQIGGKVYCTKIASKLVRTYTDRHGLKDLCRELLGIDLSKEQQSSDWGADTLSPEQQNYAAQDVLYLHRLREKLDTMLAREGRTELAQSCFDFLPKRVALDMGGWPEDDIFSH
jgi:ribonuclease D